jgi:hypothetical protein
MTLTYELFRLTKNNTKIYMDRLYKKHPLNYIRPAKVKFLGVIQSVKKIISIREYSVRLIDLSPQLGFVCNKNLGNVL